nr:site-specific integrase [Planomonospora venezuelensis]
MIAEEERTTLSPVLRADKPKSPKKVRPYLTDDELRRLLEACKGSGFGERRDTAMILILIDNGARVSGLAGLQLDDVDLRGHRLRIVLKGGDEFWAPIGKKTAAAIDRYLRVRAQHPYASATTALWLPLRGVRSGQMTRYGVADMLKRRGAQAQVAGVHPHRFRGTAAHKLLAAGAGDSDVQHILGWTSRAMVEHYTGELSLERARATHARLSPGDQI